MTLVIKIICSLEETKIIQNVNEDRLSTHRIQALNTILHNKEKDPIAK